MAISGEEYLNVNDEISKKKMLYDISEYENFVKKYFDIELH